MLTLLFEWTLGARLPADSTRRSGRCWALADLSQTSRDERRMSGVVDPGVTGGVWYMVAPVWFVAVDVVVGVTSRRSFVRGVEDAWMSGTLIARPRDFVGVVSVEPKPEKGTTAAMASDVAVSRNPSVPNASRALRPDSGVEQKMKTSRPAVLDRGMLLTNWKLSLLRMLMMPMTMGGCIL